MCAAEKEEVINAAQSSGIGDEVLRALRSDYEPEEIWRALGGYLGFPQATILLACLCQQAGELGHIFDGAASCIKQDQKANVRNLRQSGSPARSPHGWQLPQQCADQFADTLHSLSHAAPQIAEALCRLNGADGYPLAHNIQGRVGRLRGAGNAIVPQLAAEFIGAFLDVTNRAALLI